MESNVSEKHLIEEIRRRYNKMKPSERVAEIRELANNSPEEKALIRKSFPDLYEEAFSTCSGDGLRRESAPSYALTAKRR